MSLAKARSYNDKQLDTISRSAFYHTMKLAEQTVMITPVDPEKLHAMAAALDAAACGFADAESDPDVPAGMQQVSAYNDDLLNEMSRSVYVTCMKQVQAYVQGTMVMNVDQLNAYGRLADAAASGFHTEEEEE